MAFVFAKTVWNSVGGGFSNPGESKIIKVGKHKVLVSRANKLNKYGNPIHSATLVNSNGSLGKTYKSSGSATLVASECLKRNGIDVRYNNPLKRKK